CRNEARSTWRRLYIYAIERRSGNAQTSALQANIPHMLGFRCKNARGGSDIGTIGNYREARGSGISGYADIFKYACQCEKLRLIAKANTESIQIDCRFCHWHDTGCLQRASDQSHVRSLVFADLHCDVLGKDKVVRKVY